MKLKDFRRALVKNANDVTFVFNEQTAWIRTYYRDCPSPFEIDYGEQTKKYDTFIEMISDRFFSGKCIVELLSLVEFDFY